MKRKQVKPCPESKAVANLGRQFGAEQVIVLFTRRKTLECFSWGWNRVARAEARKIGNVANSAVFDKLVELQQ